MHGQRIRSRSQMVPIDQINITPLLDLVFLLLIAFMITMPLMEYGTSVNPPQMNSGELPHDDFKIIALTKKGTILYDKTPVTRDELVKLLVELKATAPKTQLLLSGDGEQFYKEVITLMTTIRHAGFENVTLVTRAEDR